MLYREESATEGQRRGDAEVKEEGTECQWSGVPGAVMKGKRKNKRAKHISDSSKSSPVGI